MPFCNAIRLPAALCANKKYSLWPMTPLIAALSMVFISNTAFAEDDDWIPSQISPSGYSGAINTPTAEVLPWGNASLALTNSNPERKRTISAGRFGSLNAGIGLLPGLELVGRLAFEGDLTCNMYGSNCNANQRDLSLSGKYQLPLKLALDTRLAIGFTDYGGAATNYRQIYAVATSQWGLLNLSLGYSRAESAQALMDGVFASSTVRLTERWTAALETDTREKRLGLHYRQPINDHAQVQLGISRKLTDATGQEPWQATVALNIQLGSVPKPAAEKNEFAEAPSSSIYRGNQSSVLQYAAPKTSASPSVPPSVPRIQGETKSAQVVEAGRLRQAMSTTLTLPTQPSLQTRAETLAEAMTQQGFSQVSVQHWSASASSPSFWWVQVEPRKWRQNHLDAIGIALAQWLKQMGENSSDELLLSLTYQREPTSSLFTNTQCLKNWVQGMHECSLGDAIQLSRARQWPQRAQDRMQPPATLSAQLDGSPVWAPQIEIAPNLRTTVGTEYGLADYSLALDIGAEVGIAPGLFWQGVFSIPIANSDDYDDGHAFAGRRHQKAGLDNNLLTYWKALPKGVSAQASVGYLSRDEKGVQADAVWMSPNGRWRAGAMAARYESDGILERARQPLLGSLRYSVIPGTWQLEVLGGQFMSGDEGYKVSSLHWFGDTRVQIYYRNSEMTGTPAIERSFLGFTLSLPLGPQSAKAIGSAATVRGPDQWSWGLETKVGENDNLLTSGYGLMPKPRHSVWTDVTDYDRNGKEDLEAQLPRLRTLLEAQLNNGK